MSAATISYRPENWWGPAGTNSVRLSPAPRKPERQHVKLISDVAVDDYKIDISQRRTYFLCQEEQAILARSLKRSGTVRKVLRRD